VNSGIILVLDSIDIVGVSSINVMCLNADHFVTFTKLNYFIRGGIERGTDRVVN
jgi:hypothetical protein